ncbi:Crp/Fnr family transcriptional regulator [Ureibacillus sp. GCM10028918]|uniref:Crp/Fnr family transcriptional regulator n=1 Tax=Ureibacillus sp. GCM10028918 TaxID=3273429 RepID=UPI00361D9BA9
MDLTEPLSMGIYQLFEEHGIHLKVEKGNFIFHEGESAGDLFFIKNGSIQISKETENGKELTFRVCGKNNIIGESSLFGPTTFHSNTAKAIQLRNHNT